MTAVEIDGIERVLGLRLPDDYRRTMQNYPFGPGTLGADMLADDAQLIARANKAPHDIIREGPPTRDYLWIGSDGGEGQFYLDLRASPHPVHAFDLETGELTLFASHLDEFVKKCTVIDSEVDEDERRAGEKKWWQFWR
jgi:SMI1-KNR4 cell-wall